MIFLLARWDMWCLFSPILDQPWCFNDFPSSRFWQEGRWIWASIDRSDPECLVTSSIFLSIWETHVSRLFLFWGKYVRTFGQDIIPDVTLPKTNSSHLKIDLWKRRFLLETTIFTCYVSFREGRLAGWSYKFSNFSCKFFGFSFHPGDLCNQAVCTSNCQDKH